MRRIALLLACLAAGFPVDAADSSKATALHQAAIRGRTALTRALLAAGADTTLLDGEHSASPLGWALFGADFVKQANGDYEGTVRALLEAGARPRDAYLSQQPAIRALFRKFDIPS